MKRLLLVLFALTVASTAAAEPAARAYLGVNGIWFREPTGYPADFEGGGNVAVSLSPHISGVGAVYYGVEHSYLRGSIGVRVTATDVNNPDFSIGIGFQRHASSEPAVRPEEWASDVSIGWRPSPLNMPKLILVAQAAYGMDTREAHMLLGARYHLDLGARP